MNIILFGAPGSGKGTQGKRISSYFSLKKIILGDILREEVKNNSELGSQVKSYMEKGLLVPDEIVSSVIDKNLPKENFILDGYPRNISQAERLDDILQKKTSKIDVFLYLNVDEKTIVDRLSKRRVCKKCGANYHIRNLAPKKEGICDNCQTPLTHRIDDTPEVIKKRWQVFKAENSSLVDFYRKKNCLLTVEASGSIDEVFDKIKANLECKSH